MVDIFSAAVLATASADVCLARDSGMRTSGIHAASSHGKASSIQADVVTDPSRTVQTFVNCSNIQVGSRHVSLFQYVQVYDGQSQILIVWKACAWFKFCDVFIHASHLVVYALY